MRKEDTMKNIKEALRLYAITDRRFLRGRTMEEMVAEALVGGVSMLQFREKDLPTEEFLEEAIAIQKLCENFDVPLIINDNIEVAIKSGADGVHLGQSDLPPDFAELKKHGLLVGVTAKTAEQAKAAYEMGADYLGVGALFGSATKEDAQSITFATCREVCESVPIPAVGIGGVNGENMQELAGLPLQGVAVISAIFKSQDSREAARRLREQSERLFA